ncbi:MAG: tRNA (adenosine(37)-N6)-threonylcarbamoyltransferase complex ATPase subunit type 1 TsaE [Erysipelotrichaceae bacterium]|nr:tRNA (adenosine(37)-N6)-threonylcarbamoyltransferase complex ATPase subunit type 1 TsaE [Erysipelotrichaceae bacterium]
MITHSAEETIQTGQKIGEKLQAGDVLILKGDLASGKTTFTKGIGKALNIKEVINSPTFTILKIYEGDHALYHIDAYRLENNLYDLGIDEYQPYGITVIEWPEYYESFLPEEYLEVDIKELSEEEREIVFIPHGTHYEELIKEMKC